MNDPVKSFSAMLRQTLGERLRPGAETFVEMFAEDGVMEFPFALPSARRVEGRKALGRDRHRRLGAGVGRRPRPPDDREPRAGAARPPSRLGAGGVATRAIVLPRRDCASVYAGGGASPLRCRGPFAAHRSSLSSHWLSPLASAPTGQSPETDAEVSTILRAEGLGRE